MIYNGKIAGKSLTTEYEEGERDWVLYEKRFGRKDIEKIFQKIIELMESDINLVKHQKTAIEWDDDSWDMNWLSVWPDFNQGVWSEEEKEIVRNFSDYGLAIKMHYSSKDKKVGPDIILSGYGL